MHPAARPATPKTAPAIIKLGTGQRYQLWAGRDAVLLVQAGAIQLHRSPVWISETMLDLQTDLQEGQHYLSEHSGWIWIEALPAAELWIYAQPRANYPLLGRLLHLVRISLASLRRGARQLLAIR